MGQPLVSGVLLPALVWRAGRVPAAARLAALTALATLLARQRLPPAQLQQLAAISGGGGGGAAAAAAGSSSSSTVSSSLVAGVAGCLDDEYEPDNRQLACATLGLLLGAGEPPAALLRCEGGVACCCQGAGQRRDSGCSWLAFPSLHCAPSAAVGSALPPPRLAALRPDLLRRLDDSSNRVRVAACGALQALLAAAQAAGEAGSSSGGGGLADGDAASLAATLLIHLDDPDAEVAGAVCAALEQLAAARPAVVHPLVQAAAAQPERQPLLARVMAACE